MNRYQIPRGQENMQHRLWFGAVTYLLHMLMLLPPLILILSCSGRFALLLLWLLFSPCGVEVCPG